MATKKTSALDAMARAAKSRGEKPKAAKATSIPKGSTQTGDTLTTAVHLRRDHWELLRLVSFARAAKSGGRASVSAVLTDLVESNRTALEREAGK